MAPGDTTIERGALRVRIEMSDATSRLNGGVGHPIDIQGLLDHMCSFGERCVHRGFVTRFIHPGNVVGAAFPQRGRAGFDGVAGQHHRRQGVVINLHQLGSVFGLPLCIGHHVGDHIAHHARAIPDDSEHARLMHGAAVGSLHRHAAGDAAQFIRGDVGAGVDGDYAGRGPGFGGIDRDDARMRVRCAHHARVQGVARQFHVRGIAAFTS